MLTKVSVSQQKRARLVTLKHPNNYDVTFLRKVVDRLSPQGEVAGSQSWGGANVMSSEDEEDIHYEVIGIGWALITKGLQEDLVVNDGMDSEYGTNRGAQTTFFLEPEAAAPSSDYFEIKKRDIFSIQASDNAVISYEIVDIIAVSKMPPYSKRYVCDFRNDLTSYIEP